MNGADGAHIRYVPSALARGMVVANIAAVHNANGKVRTIRLLESASTHACRIGEPTTFT